MSTELQAILAEVCGYHDGPGCEHCADAVQVRRGWGWTDKQIIADATLYRDDRDAWYAQVATRAEAGS